MKASDFTKIPISELTTTPTTHGFWELYPSTWWAVTDDDCVLLYKGYSKQCNSNKKIVENIISSPEHPGVKVVLLEAVWFKHNCNDY